VQSLPCTLRIAPGFVSTASWQPLFYRRASGLSMPDLIHRQV